MSFLYPIVSQVTGSLNSGSYLNKTDYSLFVDGPQSDFWYGTSGADAVEFAVYDLNDNLLSWVPMEVVGDYKNEILTYYDSKNSPVSYNFRQFIFDRLLYKTQKVLVEPLSDISSSNLPSGNYILSYEFTRYLAGTPSDPLIIKEISPSKTELKLIPSGQPSIEYQAFCVNKIPLDDVSPLYLTLTKVCPYQTLYNNSVSGSQDQIDLIKNMFFIPSDGKFVEFLKFLYEDFIKYTNQSGEQASSYTRIQGIRTYFSNFLVSNTHKIYSFNEIKSSFEVFVNQRLDLLLTNFKSAAYLPARQYLFNLFVEDYFSVIHDMLQSTYQEKYHDPLKNVLAYGLGQFIPILSTAFVDERQSDSDPLTLLVKLQSPVNDDISIKSNVWVSNAGMIPVLFNAVIKEGSVGKTIKISSPDFTLVPKNVSFTNTNTSFDNTDLTTNDLNDSLVSISKKIQELNVDYTQLSNFVVFSSAELRHNIFKNKMLSLNSITSSLMTLEANYSSSGFTYPYYTAEKESLQTQEADVINSFDGWESYLYSTGYYVYNPTTKTFASQSFVDETDVEVVDYDKVNRDSLVNNTPEHIVSDSGNDEYLIFLSMIGHFFDNLYLYIKSLPTQRSGENNNTFARNILQQMLQSFGWNLDTSLESLDISDNFLDVSLNGDSIFSADERTRQIWNRILNTLPEIYKTKGTEECVKMVLACYGVPSTMISIKEYGGIDYSHTGKTSYSIEEKLFMLTFQRMGEYISLPFYPTIRTVEFKVALDPTQDYKLLERVPLAVKYNSNNTVDWSMGVFKEKGQHLGRAYFEIATGSVVTLVSDPLPIFNGEIFSMMVRKNDPDPIFEPNPNVDLIPTKYDLRVQRKEDGRSIFNSFNSTVLTQSFNYAFENFGTLYFGNSQAINNFYGLLDKVLVWDVPVSDTSFDDHCNNISSYSYTGSAVPHQVLYFRMNFDYPIDLSVANPTTIVNANEFYSASIFASAYDFDIQAYSASVDNCNVVSHSAFPYQFTEIPYNQTFTISTYGPNKYKNEKIQQIDLPLAARLDPNERSSFSPNTFITPDSNQIGLFADPNDYKNKDIFRYLGDYGLVGLLAAPDQMFDDRYYPLKNVRELYNQSGNKRVLYTEMFTLYKFYFDRSIFETIKQLIPARNNVLAGILIEPTVLERPKYPYKRISTEAGTSYTSSATPYPVTASNNVFIPTLSMNDTVFSAGTIKGDFISVDFRLNKDLFASQLYENVPFFIPEGPFAPTDPLFIQFSSLRNKLVYVDSGWIKKNPSAGELQNVEQHPDWPIPAQDYGPNGPGSNLVVNGNFKFVGTLPGFYPTGSGYYYLKQCYFYVAVNANNAEVLDNLSKNVQASINLSTIRLPTFDYHTITRDGQINDIDNPEELGVYCDDTGKIVETEFSSSRPRFMVKKWTRDNTFTAVGDYSKPQTVTSQSLFFYSTEVWLNPNYANVIYTQSLSVLTQYYELFSGYSRNHLTHKRLSFSNESAPMAISINSFDRYVKSRQTIDTTVDQSGSSDGSLPVQTVNVSNINVVKTDNVLS